MTDSILPISEIPVISSLSMADMRLRWLNSILRSESEQNSGSTAAHITIPSFCTCTSCSITEGGVLEHRSESHTLSGSPNYDSISVLHAPPNSLTLTLVEPCDFSQLLDNYGNRRSSEANDEDKEGLRIPICEQAEKQDEEDKVTVEMKLKENEKQIKELKIKLEQSETQRTEGCNRMIRLLTVEDLEKKLKETNIKLKEEESKWKETVSKREEAEIELNEIENKLKEAETKKKRFKRKLKEYKKQAQANKKKRPKMERNATTEPRRKVEKAMLAVEEAAKGPNIRTLISKANCAWEEWIKYVRNENFLLVESRNELQCYYPHKGKRICAIIDVSKHDKSKTQQTDREGSDKDVDQIKQLFEDRGFEIKKLQDPTAEEIRKFLRELSKLDSQHGAFVCFLMAHGTNGAIYGSDGGKVNIDDLLSLFKFTICKSLMGKPKIFFVNACRISSASEPAGPSTPNPSYGALEADFLICYATVKNTHAYRSTKYGSMFIETLCGAIEYHGRNKHLIDILTEANGEISATDISYVKKTVDQCFVIESTLTRNFML